MSEVVEPWHGKAETLQAVDVLQAEIDSLHGQLATAGNTILTQTRTIERLRNDNRELTFAVSALRSRLETIANFVSNEARRA